MIELKNKIENLDVKQQIEILRILKKNKVDMSENKNGVFINLSKVSKDIIKQLEEYNTYILQQNKDITHMEEKQIKIEKDYFNN